MPTSRLPELELTTDATPAVGVAQPTMLETSPLRQSAMHSITKLKPNIDPVVLEVIDAAALLDTTEFNIFCLAYTHWYGEKASVEVIEPHFNAYMFSEIVPFWVHHFTRRMLRLHAMGHLKPDDYSPRRRPVTTRSVLLGWFHAMLLILILVVLFGITADSGHLLSVARHCYFPPCY